MDTAKLTPSKTERQLVEEKQLKDLESADWEVVNYGWQTVHNGRKVSVLLFGGYWLYIEGFPDRIHVTEQLLSAIKEQQIAKFRDWVG